MTTIDDTTIQSLIVEPKPALALAELMPAELRRGHNRAEKQVETATGTKFVVNVRQNPPNPADFSVILGYELPDRRRVFRLRRHNGASHRHRNDIERTDVEGPHVHVATERYQVAGFKEDGYAEATDAYSDLAGAIDHMLDVAGFEAASQSSLFRP